MKMLKLSNRKEGFTIIEVVLVLAIAGLIFLMVFLALPALQRSQRDSQRKQMAKMLVGVYLNYSANNNGKIVDGRLQKLVDRGYINKQEALDPSTGEMYELDTNALGGYVYRNYSNIAPGSYGYDAGGYCSGNEPKDIGGNGNLATVVVVFGLENGWVCASNDMR